MVAHPGVAPNDPEDELRVHKYYQWVCFVLFFQAFAFYLPRLIWKRVEGNRIHTLSSVGFDELAKDQESIDKRRKQCVDYFHSTLGTNDGWALKYAVCEVVNFINVVIQIDLTDRFVGRALSKYGLSLMQFSGQDPMRRTDPMAKSFPTVTRCTFNMIGPAGNIINFDRSVGCHNLIEAILLSTISLKYNLLCCSLCILPLNIYNEKFYPLLW